MKLCWVCQNIATTADHVAKATDVRAVFGRNFNGERVSLFGPDGEVSIAQGPKSDVFKYQSQNLCARCNDTRFQPHDLAYEALAAKLETLPNHRRRQKIDLSLLPTAVQPELIGTFMYFQRQLGNMLHEYGCPIDLQSFAVSLLANVPHPHIFIAFSQNPALRGTKRIEIGPLEGKILQERIVAVQWFYAVEHVKVSVGYAAPPWRPYPGYGRVWNPSTPLLRPWFT